MPDKGMNLASIQWAKRCSASLFNTLSRGRIPVAVHSQVVFGVTNTLLHYSTRQGNEWNFSTRVWCSQSLSLSKLSAFRYRNPWQFNSISGYHSYYGRNLEVWNYNFNVNWYRFDFNHPISFWTLILFIYYFFLYFLIFSSIILTFLRSFYYFLFPIRFNFVAISSRFCKLFIIKLFAFKWLNNPSFLLVAIS